MCTWIAVLAVILPDHLCMRRSSCLATTIGNTRHCLPLLLSLIFIHTPSGHWDIALGLGGGRGLALIAVLLAASSWTNASDLAKALQEIGLSPKLTYVLGTALNMLPMARRYAATYTTTAGRQSQIKHVAFPLITRMLVHSTGRQLPLQTSGVLLPGRRTVLRPVPFLLVDWIICGLAVAGAGSLSGERYSESDSHFGRVELLKCPLCEGHSEYAEGGCLGSTTFAPRIMSSGECRRL